MTLLRCLWLLFAIIVPCFIFSIDGEQGFVRPSENQTCPAQPCLTLNDYARQANQYFLDNTTFVFLSGVHRLDIRLRLENISNVSLIVLNEAQDDTIQVFLSPLVNITWVDCENIVISGLVFVLSGDSASRSFFSALVFQSTTCFLSQLILFGNGSLQSTAIRTHSSQVEISDVMVLGATSILGAALVAFNSTIDFLGQNIFINNTAAQGGAMIFIKCVSNFSGNISFINNTAISNTSIPLGGAIYCGNSFLSFSGTAIFQCNQANSIFPVNLATGGAITALSGSTLTFKATSSLLFTKNTATGQGGAISVSTSEVSLLGSALFEGNVAVLGGGAIKGDSSSRIYCRGRNIIFQNNRVNRSGGAVYTQSSDVELEEILFVGNVASNGGAISYFNGFSLHISTCEFVNNTASISSGAVYITGGTSVLFDGTNHFEWNYAPLNGAVSTYTSTNVTFIGENTFYKNTATIGCGGLDLIVSNSTISGMTKFYGNYGAYGGGIRGIQSNLTICGKFFFMDNTADLQGGGLLFVNGTLNITDQSSFIRNNARSDGSALFATNSIVTVSGNTSISDSHSASVDGAIGLRNSIGVFTRGLTFINNSASNGGGFSLRNSVVDYEGCIQYLSNRAT